MTIERITYQKKFGLPNFSNELIGMEIILMPGEDMDEAINVARKKSEDNHRKAYPLLYNNTPDVNIREIARARIPERPPDEHKQPAPTIEEQISSCTSKAVLKAVYEKLVKGKPELQKIYDKKLKELT